MGIPIDSLLNLFFSLRHNSFHFEGSLFNQIQGLSMRWKLSPSLAILAPIGAIHAFLRTLPFPFAFLRYIDDCAVIIDKDADTSSLLLRLNSVHASIKFKIEKPENFDFLPILDTAIRINPDGNIEHKCIVKDANKGLFINATSALPASIKRSVMHRA